MITDAVLQVITPQASVLVEISIPDGEERAKKTLNTRLGILGGLSILGTTGIVRPISAKAWTDTLDAALDVAKACQCRTVVLSTGRTSEMAVQNFERVRGQGSRIQQATLFDAPIPHDADPVPLKEEAYIMMGDHIAYALKACQARGFTRPIIACQFAKLLKIACGHENTHAAASELDLATLLEWARGANIAPTIITSIEQANTAREIAIACSFDNALLDLVFQHAAHAIADHALGLEPHFMVADYSGERLYHSR
jgi:cobalt-precorrin-5B (C1)-methyltransferase